jgi:hypothetical protein
MDYYHYRFTEVNARMGYLHSCLFGWDRMLNCYDAKEESESQ